MKQRATVTTRCVADQYHAPNERIIEITFPNGAGCLVSLRTFPGDPLSRNVIDIYRADPSVRVVCAGDHSLPSELRRDDDGTGERT